MSKYILNEQGEPVPEPDLMKWAEWFERTERHVAHTYVGELWISTVFLGLDHQFDERCPPILWETMVFDKDGNDKAIDRCAGNREQAEAMHEKMVAQFHKKAVR